jgi:hypothetical protein
MPEEQYGPYIRWRESSFLENPKVPSKVLEQAVSVNICSESQTSGCADGTGPAAVHEQELRMQPSLDSEQILRWVSACFVLQSPGEQAGAACVPETIL